MSKDLQKAYEEIHAKYEKALGKQPKLRKDLNDVTLNNPRLLLAEGFRQLEESKQPAETETTIQSGKQTEKTEDTNELNDYLSTIDATMAQMDELLQAMNKTN